MKELESDSESLGFKMLRDEVSRLIGVDYRNYSEKHLIRRFHARMRVVGTTTFRDYLDLLRREKSEIDKLRDLLTVNVTQFKRDTPVWDKIEKEVIPLILEEKAKKGVKRVSVWSAGCATGEEPYSLAICFLNNDVPKSISLTIKGTDLDSSALEFAKDAIYPENSLRSLSRYEKLDFFSKKDGLWELKPEVKNMVRYENKDIFKSMRGNRYDLILCRNIMIYFSDDAKVRLMEALVDSLNPGGYLNIGMSESLRAPARDKVEVYDLKKRIFFKDH